MLDLFYDMNELYKSVFAHGQLYAFSMKEAANQNKGRFQSLFE